MAEYSSAGSVRPAADMSIADLISAPLAAAAEAQLNLAKSTVDFISSVGMEQDSSGKTVARNISFNIQVPDGEDGRLNEMSVQAPLLAIVPVPNLAVEEVNVDFQMEVLAATKTAESSQSSGETETQVSVTGKVSSSAEHTRETNQSAKYQIQVKARKQENPEGLSRLLDILAATVQGK